MEDVIATGSDPVNDVSLPEAPQTEAPKPASSPREALERAFGGLDKPAQPDAPKPASDRSRDEAGRFAPKAETAPVAGQKPQDKPAAEMATEQAAKPLAAPTRFAKAAQAEWANVPEVVRQETERAITELTQGIEKYKAEAAAFEPIRKYDEMARQSGTDLKTALDSYVGIENAWRQDPVKGFAAVCQNMGVNPVAQAQAILQALSGQPQTNRGDTPEVAMLKREIEALKAEVGTVGRTFKERDALEQVNRFAADHPHFEAVSDTIAEMLSTGFAKNLEDAYQKAIRLNPEVQALIASTEAAKAAPQAEPAHTRKAALSITGSPNGSNPGSKTPAGSPREALGRAFSSIGLS